MTKEKGITLISLVITVILLMILSAVVITSVIDADGLFSKANRAKEEMRYSQIYEAKSTWEVDKEVNKDTAQTASEVINNLYDEDLVNEEERDILLEGDSIIVAEKEIAFGLSEGVLYLTLTKSRGANDEYAVIYAIPKVGGVPEFLTYEAYAKPQEVLADKTPAEKEQMVAGYITSMGYTLEQFYSMLGVSTFEEFYTAMGYSSADDMIISMQIIKGTEYNQYKSNYEEAYGYVTVTKPNGSTSSVGNLNQLAYGVVDNGTFTFTAEYNGQTVTKTMEISSIEVFEEMQLAKENENTYKITCIEDLIKLSENVNNDYNYEGKTINLTKTLDFNQDSSYNNPADTTTFGDYNGDGTVEGIKAEVTKVGERGFIPIAGRVIWLEETSQTKRHYFRGTFEGNGYSINNIYINNNDIYYIGLFSNNYGTIQNLRVDGSITAIDSSTSLMNSGYNIGGIVSENYGTINNCENNVEFTVNTYAAAVGGIAAANASSANIINCKNTVDINFNENSDMYMAYVGGIAATNYTSNITNCVNTGNITFPENCNISYALYVGGILGDCADYTSKIKECVNTGNITTNSIPIIDAGGIAGAFDNSGKAISCSNFGDITLNNVERTFAGGIIGFSDPGLTVNCFNIGELTVNLITTDAGGSAIGGIIGRINGGQSRGVLNAGKTTVTGTTGVASIGGAIGESSNGINFDIYNIGQIEVDANIESYIGGVFGKAYVKTGNEPTGGYTPGIAEKGVRRRT